MVMHFCLYILADYLDKPKGTKRTDLSSLHKNKFTDLSVAQHHNIQ